MKLPISIDIVKKLINDQIDLYDKIPKSHLTYFDVLYEHFQTEMPYGVQKARTGDPDSWIIDKLCELYNC